jgi:hypothetical protein
VTTTKETQSMARIAKILDAMPKDAQLRCLAYLSARALDVGTCEVSDALYEEAARARDATPNEGNTPKEGNG